MKTIAKLSILLISFLLFACSTQTENTEIRQTTPKQEVVKTYNPVSISILDDYSGSRDQFGIPKLALSDLQPAIDFVVQNGGALSFGIIEANSDYTTVQFTVNTKLIPVKPAEPNKSDFTNSFSYYNAKNEYEKVTLVKYKQDLQKYQAKLQADISRFKDSVKQVMDGNHNSGNTDIGNAVLRAVNFHKTADAKKHYTLLISDGVDYVNTPVPEQNISIEYYLCYGSNKAQGQWLKSCKPVITPDLRTAYGKIGIYY
ncbi:MAG: hypothetical protein GXO49_05160 [Chlorobi bacterium]|nr:hypothetical protein [Chlorobiota bacterium]